MPKGFNHLNFIICVKFELPLTDSLRRYIQFYRLNKTFHRYQLPHLQLQLH